jgi:high-affinity nickel-transport protein
MPDDQSLLDPCSARAHRPRSATMTLLAVTALGFFLGVRHATDADHVVAITTIVCRERSARGAMLVGALWGLGHTVTILLVGGAIVLFGLAIPAPVAFAMELAVALMLIVLGAMNVRRALRRARERHEHAPAPRGGRPMTVVAAIRPLAIGIVHGLAGSAALALLVLTTIRDARRALLYLGVFGAGTVAGMMLLTTAMTLPIALAARRFGSLERLMTGVTGAVSLAFGLLLIYRHMLGEAAIAVAHAGGQP